LTFIGVELWAQGTGAPSDTLFLRMHTAKQPATTTSPTTTPPPTEHSTRILILAGRIEFEDVHFEYQEGNPLLRGISFAVEAGQTLALVGSSGSGKSSILRLLYRFYDPQRGSIRIDGQDVRAVQLDSLRRCLAVVPQDVVLFNETVSYNLSYGDPNVSREALIHYAKQAQIHDTIQRMPLGYDTIVGERGLKLSGGEKQRIAIARALRKRAPILLCDEATSAVDTVTEQEILRELRSSAKSQQTCILIAHNLSTVAHADQILVLKHGQVMPYAVDKTASTWQNLNSLMSSCDMNTLHCLPALPRRFAGR